MASHHSIVLTPEQAQQLQALLAADSSFSPCERDYASFAYEKQGLSLAFFPKRHKLLIQGKASYDFVTFTLEPKITGILDQPQLSEELANVESSAPKAKPSAPKQLDARPHIGVDESGKGDYFGPLVIAGVYCANESAQRLFQMGCTDSKTISSSAKIHSLAEKILSTPGVVTEVVCIGPERYNELYAKIGNLNKLLAWGHARVIASIHAKVPDCPRALSDQFAKEWVLKAALAPYKLPIELEQRTKGESDIAVAAASILARSRFVRWMEKASAAAGQKLPLGCAPHVLKAAKELVSTHGRAQLNQLAKLHFKLTAQLES